MNNGKKFEDDFRKSIGDQILLYRLPDAAQSFGKSSNLRFSKKNPFDYLLWDSSSRILYALELKTVQGKSISFERSKDESGKIHYHQIEGLNDWNKYNGIICGFIIQFRQDNVTLFIEIDQFNKLISILDKKSFTMADLDNNHINYIIIPNTKLRVRYRYDVAQFINDSKHYANIVK